MPHHYTLIAARQIVISAGFHNSKVDWEDDQHIYCFSRECMKAGCPVYVVHVFKPREECQIIRSGHQVEEVN